MERVVMERALAPAKINLYLHVVGRRDDGYHLLDSLVMFADLGDTLTVRPRPAGGGAPTLVIDGPFAPALAAESAESNLVVRAARELALATGRDPAVALTLTKRLPVASGIGGGSADAAACLRVLARLWRLPEDLTPLIPIAARLGADVPVCLASVPAFFGGIGEILTPAPALPDCPALLVNPGVPVPTPAVFRARTGPFTAPARFTAAPDSVATLARWLGDRANDLTAPAITVAPVIATVLAALNDSESCLLARLSGSGATCFALYPDRECAAQAATRLAQAHPDWWVRPCQLVSRNDDNADPSPSEP